MEGAYIPPKIDAAVGALEWSHERARARRRTPGAWRGPPPRAWLRALVKR